jgi:hypothetical protein
VDDFLDRMEKESWGDQIAYVILLIIFFVLHIIL